MAYGAAHNAYRQTSAQTATPERLLIMLYDGLLKFMGLAKNALEQENISDAHTNLVRAQDIVSELRSSLKSEYEISKSLDALYDFIWRKLVEANVQKCIEIIDEIRPLVEELRDTWVQAAVICTSGQTPSV